MNQMNEIFFLYNNTKAIKPAQLKKHLQFVLVTKMMEVIAHGNYQDQWKTPSVSANQHLVILPSML